MNVRKLQLHEKVEVRQLEEGLKGSWHPGVIVGLSDVCRKVKYDELLCETGKSKLVESIPVTGAIEGLYQRPCVKYNYRGRIRPIPHHQQPCTVLTKLSFGVCVDALFREAWWEGVIFDCDEGAEERRVYFPDEVDERVFKLTDLRLSSDWDEFTGQWRERGVWSLVNIAKEYKKDGSLSQLIRRAWVRLKAHYGFQKMITDWTCGAHSVWKEYFREVIYDMTTKLRGNNFESHSVKKRKHRSKKFEMRFLNASVLTRSMQKKKEKFVRLAVRTRRMCMSDAEDSLVVEADSSRYLTDGHCMRSKPVTTDACLYTCASKASEKGEFVQSNCRGLTSCEIMDEECRSRMCQNDGVTSITPHSSGNALLISKSNHVRRRKRKLARNEMMPRKLMSARPTVHKLERHASCVSSIKRQVHDRVSLQLEDNDFVHRRRDMMLLKRKKSGVTMRYPSHRKGGRTRIQRHNVVKRRSPKRIKKLSSRKIQDHSVIRISTLQKEAEALKSDNNEGILSEGVQHFTASSHEHGPQDTLDGLNKLKEKKRRCHDSVCLVCQYGGELLHCDLCLSSYHLTCIDLEEVPSGESFCPSCKCGICGMKHSLNDDQLYTQSCYQCSRRYHVACLNKTGRTVSEDSILSKFCSKSCFEICARLHELLQTSNPTAMEGFNWTVTRSRRNDCNVYNERVHPLVQVSQVLNVFHECFEPITEPHTGRDLVSDIVYNSGSKFRRLDFHGFYVITLVHGEELVCVATIRIYGQKVAEMPLIATRFKYRRKGMCRLLVNELEKMLVEMGVERLVLPGISQLSDTWVSSFGFAEMPEQQRKELLGYPFVLFQGTSMFQKLLRSSAPRDPLPAAPNQEQHGPSSVQVNKPECDHNKRSSPRCKRRGKLEAPTKKKMVTDGPDRDQSTYKCVYKRRRVQASKETPES